MLLNNFYTLTRFHQEPGSLQAEICINPEHAIFNGHFPGQPVVPGVCMVQIVKELMEQATGKTLLLRKGSQLKFLQLLIPAEAAAVQVQISWQQEDNSYATQAGFIKEAAAVFKLSGTFAV